MMTDESDLVAYLVQKGNGWQVPEGKALDQVEKLVYSERGKFIISFTVADFVQCIGLSANLELEYVGAYEGDVKECIETVFVELLSPIVTGFCFYTSQTNERLMLTGEYVWLMPETFRLNLGSEGLGAACEEILGTVGNYLSAVGRLTFRYLTNEIERHYFLTQAKSIFELVHTTPLGKT